MAPRTERNAENNRLTVRIDNDTKAEMIRFADEHDLSLAWIVKKGWDLLKKAIKSGEVKF